jgi:hypothetical protein
LYTVQRCACLAGRRRRLAFEPNVEPNLEHT